MIVPLIYYRKEKLAPFISWNMKILDNYAPSFDTSIFYILTLHAVSSCFSVMRQKSCMSHSSSATIVLFKAKAKVMAKLPN